MHKIDLVYEMHSNIKVTMEITPLCRMQGKF